MFWWLVKPTGAGTQYPSANEFKERLLQPIEALRFAWIENISQIFSLPTQDRRVFCVCKGVCNKTPEFLGTAEQTLSDAHPCCPAFIRFRLRRWLSAF